MSKKTPLTEEEMETFGRLMQQGGGKELTEEEEDLLGRGLSLMYPTREEYEANRPRWADGRLVTREELDQLIRSSLERRLRTDPPAPGTHESDPVPSRSGSPSQGCNPSTEASSGTEHGCPSSGRQDRD